MQINLALVPILALLPPVAAHGYVKKVVIDGTIYIGPLPADVVGATDSPSPIRQIANIGPVKGATNPEINCGLSAQLASLVVPANPGSSMEFYWGNPSGGNWPHVTGPLMTYMASCNTATCDKFNGSSARWFKIDQIGKKSDGNTWYQQDVANGNPVTLALPSQVEPGEYLVRHEIISLQNAVSPGGAEFYPSCIQIRIRGSQSGIPNQTVTFPGAYSDTDPGILDPKVYDPGSSYVFPGPPVSNLASPSDMSTSNGGQNNGSQSSPVTPDDTTTTGYVPTDTSTTSGYGMYGAQPMQSNVEQTQFNDQPMQPSVEPTQSTTFGVWYRRSDAWVTQSGFEPTQSSVRPTEPGFEPTQSGTQDGDQPAQSGAQPTQSGLEPSQSSFEPPQSSFEPSQSGFGPMQSSAQPTQSGFEPTQSGFGPSQSGIGPAQEPSQSGVQPTPSGVQPTPSDTQSTQSGVGPIQSGVGPTQPGDQPTVTSPATCGFQRREASRARLSNRARRKRRAHPMRGFRHRARHS